MTCDCRTRVEFALRANAEQKFPAATDHKASLQGYGFTLQGNKMAMVPVMPYEITMTVTSSRGATTRKKSKGSMFFSFCPFCGKSLKEELAADTAAASPPSDQVEARRDETDPNVTPPPISDEDIDTVFASKQGKYALLPTHDAHREYARAIESHVNEQWRQRLEQVAWTLQSELDAKKTSCRAHLWFSDPKNSAWTPLYRINERGSLPVKVEMRGDEPAAPFQARVQPWMQACFGAEIAADKLERGDRLLEEVLELLQSGDYPPERVAALTRYVYDRPVGEPAQEVGGVMVTLAAYCLAHGLDMHEAGEVELERIWTKVETIRAKQAAKPKGSALPVASAAPRTTSPDEVAEAMRQRFVKLPRFSFWLGDPPAVRRVPDRHGNWLDFETVHTLFDPVHVDAALRDAGFPDAAGGNQ